LVFVLVLSTALAAGCGADASLGPDQQPPATTDPSNTSSSYCAELNPAAGTPRSLPARLFPADNWWNLNILKAPVDPRSATCVAALASARLSYVWGNNYGFPFITAATTSGSSSREAATGTRVMTSDTRFPFLP
jgi:hypothetical protein